MCTVGATGRRKWAMHNGRVSALHKLTGARSLTRRHPQTVEHIDTDIAFEVDSVCDEFTTRDYFWLLLWFRCNFPYDCCVWRVFEIEAKETTIGKSKHWKKKQTWSSSYVCSWNTMKLRFRFRCRAHNRTCTWTAVRKSVASVGRSASDSIASHSFLYLFCSLKSWVAWIHQ